MSNMLISIVDACNCIEQNKPCRIDEDVLLMDPFAYREIRGRWQSPPPRDVTIQGFWLEVDSRNANEVSDVKVMLYLVYKHSHMNIGPLDDNSYSYLLEGNKYNVALWRRLGKAINHNPTLIQFDGTKRYGRIQPGHPVTKCLQEFHTELKNNKSFESLCLRQMGFEMFDLRFHLQHNKNMKYLTLGSDDLDEEARMNFLLRLGLGEEVDDSEFDNLL
jgi:hypothetical protein